MSSIIVLIYLLIFATTATVNSHNSIDARTFYHLAEQLCKSSAPDIQLYNLSGLNLDTLGQSQDWSCRLLSFQESQVYWFSYSLDTVMLDSMTTVPFGPIAVDSNWINSDKSLLIAEQNGGAAYRFNNRHYRIEAFLDALPFPPFYTYWDIKYTDPDSISPPFEIRIDAITENIITAIEANDSQAIFRKFTLFGNYPNPFNPTTTISYKLLALSDVDLSIFNLLGQRVATLVSAKQPVGNYKLQWDASGFASGIYVCKLTIDHGYTQARKLVLLR